MRYQPDVLVIGRSCVDYLVVLEKFPSEDTKAPIDCRIVEGGGQGGTASSCIARLGGRVLYVGRLGEDAEGRFCLERLQAFGVDTTLVQTIGGGKTPAAYIVVTRSNGKRTILYERNALPRLNPEDLRPALTLKPKAILLDPETTYLAAVLGREKTGGIKILYDCERWRDGMEAMMQAADFFIPSAGFLDSERLGLQRLPFAEKMRRFRSRVRGELVVTRGAKGAYYFSGNTLFRVAPPVVPVKDTTGAGDNFHAAFALAVARGWEIHKTVRFSVAVASLSCREYGGRNGIPEAGEALHLASGLKTEPI